MPCSVLGSTRAVVVVDIDKNTLLSGKLPPNHTKPIPKHNKAHHSVLARSLGLQCGPIILVLVRLVLVLIVLACICSHEHEQQKRNQSSIHSQQTFGRLVVGALVVRLVLQDIECVNYSY